MDVQDDVIQRIRYVMKLNRKTSVNSFAKLVGIDQSNLGKMLGGAIPISERMLTRIADNCGIRYNWLANGEEPMEKPENEKESGLTQTPALFVDKVPNVPIVHIDSVGGIHSGNDIDTPEYIEGYIPVPGAREGDLAIYQSGVSMTPAIPPGAILLIREVPGWREYIGYGDVFVLLLDDGRRITKEIHRYEPDPMNFYWCVSYNETVADEELPKKMIRRVWKVIKIMINKGW